jgi:hypothetical protein
VPLKTEPEYYFANCRPLKKRGKRHKESEKKIE